MRGERLSRSEHFKFVALGCLYFFPRALEDSKYGSNDIRFLLFKKHIPVSVWRVDCRSTRVEAGMWGKRLQQ